MARVLITGSTDGLGRATARTLIDEGHDVVLHARSQQRASALSDLAARAAGVVIGDLSSAAQTAALADQVNGLGRMGAVIHNAGVYGGPARGTTPEGHARTLAVNVLAPYLLTALIDRPDRLVYLSSGMHRGASGSLRDIDWTERRWNASRAYSESKLHITTLALAIARRWPQVLSHAVDPGWVPTRMGGPGAPDDLSMGHLTQAWLAVSDDPAARVSGGYWHHMSQQAPDPQSVDVSHQNALMDRLAELTGIASSEHPGVQAPVGRCVGGPSRLQLNTALLPSLCLTQYCSCMATEVPALDAHLQELRRGTVVLAVLVMLRDPDYGYRLLEALARSGFAVDANTLYPLLRRMEKQGLLTSDWNTDEPRPRKYYRTTTAGQGVAHELRTDWARLTAAVSALDERMGDPS